MHKKQFYPVLGAGSSAAMVCSECRRTQEQPFDQSKCQNWECSSHLRKAVAAGPSYVPTTREEDPVAQRVGEMVRGIKVEVSAQEGLGGGHRCR